MAFARHDVHLIDYHSYQLPGSAQLLRGPACNLDRPYLAFLGGAETYGRFLNDPFPKLVGQRLRLPVLNLGCVNAGPDVYLNDPALLCAAQNADLAIVEVMGAQNMTNRYYSVHPRRNDRFVKPSRQLVLLYPEVDFTEINFTRHLLLSLQQVSRRRFRVVQAELQQAWVARMERLLATVGSAILFWFSNRPPGGASAVADLSANPLFITRQMLDAVITEKYRLVSLVADQKMINRGHQGLFFTAMDCKAAETLLGYEAHRQAADLLVRETQL